MVLDIRVGIARYHWLRPGVDSDVEQKISTYPNCILRKSKSGKFAELFNISSTQPLDIICTDYLTLEQSKECSENILATTCTDHFTRFWFFQLQWAIRFLWLTVRMWKPWLLVMKVCNRRRKCPFVNRVDKQIRQFDFRIMSVISSYLFRVYFDCSYKVVFAAYMFVNCIIYCDCIVFFFVDIMNPHT